MQKSSSDKKSSVKVQQDELVLDANGKILGRLAAEIAVALQGKHKADFAPNRDVSPRIFVENIQELQVSGKKMDKKLYWRYSGYPGGIRKRGLQEVWDKNPADVLRRAVRGMLPKNTLRPARLKKLIIR